MSKVLLVARRQFLQEASQRSFVLVLFSMPLFMIVTVGFGFLVARMEEKETILGYVDQAGVVADPTLVPVDEEISFVAFDDRPTAQEALDAGQVSAYYVISPDYFETHKAELVYEELPDYGAQRQFTELVRANLVADEAPAAAERLLAGTTVTIISTESGREYPNGGDPTLGLFFPLIAAVFFIFLMITTAGYMTSVLVEEKVNRTVEIVFTSISTGRLMTGKILGALGIAGLQLAVWLLFLAGAIVVGGQVLDIGWMQDLSLNWRDVLAVIVVALPTYFFAATLMALIGSMLADTMEAQQAASLSMIFLFLPIYLIVPVIGNPDGLLAQALTFFPLTSLLTLGMRSLVMVVPTWQVAVAAVTALLGSLFLVWLASRAFRLSMLRYGQRLRLRELLRRGGSNRERAGGPAASSA